MCVQVATMTNLYKKEKYCVNEHEICKLSKASISNGINRLLEPTVHKNK